MTVVWPQVLLPRLPSTATRLVSCAFPQLTAVAWPAESLAKMRLSRPVAA